jgi:hypothetical protein
LAVGEFCPALRSIEKGRRSTKTDQAHIKTDQTNTRRKFLMVSKTQKRRPENPAWRKGGRSPNPGGRPRVLEEVRAACQARGQEIVNRLFEIANDHDASTYGRVVALKTLAAYAWGSPISQTAVMMLDARRGDGGSLENDIVIMFGKNASPDDADALPLSEFAERVQRAKVVENVPPRERLAAIEDLRPAKVSERRVELERALAETNREIERLQRVQEQRFADVEPLDRPGWSMDGQVGRSDWPGRTR